MNRAVSALRQPKSREIDRQAVEGRYRDSVVFLPRYVEMVGATLEAITFERSGCRIDDPVMHHTMDLISSGFRLSIQRDARWRENLYQEKRRALDTAPRNLRSRGHHQVRLNDISIRQDDV